MLFYPNYSNKKGYFAQNTALQRIPRINGYRLVIWFKSFFKKRMVPTLTLGHVKYKKRNSYT